METSQDYIRNSYSKAGGLATTIFFATASVLMWFGGAALDMIRSERMQMLAIDLLWLHSRGMIQLENFGQWTYDEFENVKYCVDNMNWLKSKVNDFTSVARKEPEAEYWVQSCKLLCETNTPSRYYENYQILTENENISDTFNSVMQSISTTSDCTNGLILMKQHNKYMVRTCDVDTNSIVGNDYQLSSFKPMSISYIHSQMDEPVSITLPTNMWCVDNQLFSPIFVRRCLEYIEDSFIFDGKYTIQIIDSSVNIYTIHPYEYIRVQDDSIEVISVLKEEDADDVESEHADTGSEHADTGSEHADTGSEHADTGSEHADTGSEHADDVESEQELELEQIENIINYITDDE